MAARVSILMWYTTMGLIVQKKKLYSVWNIIKIMQSVNWMGVKNNA